jgi:ribonuclease III
MNELEQKITYSFSDKKLLERALTHSSANAKRTKQDNERLEFLGDRVLGLIVAERLLEKFSSEKEGDIAKRHTAFVCKEQLVKVAKEINLASFITMSAGEEKEGGRANESIMADGIEAILGAIYLDSDINKAKNFIDKFWDFNADVNPPVDAKTALQEWAQSKGLGLPAYEKVGQSGTDHNPIFEVKVTVKNHNAVTGQGRNKKEAEKSAAAEFLKNI